MPDFKAENYEQRLAEVRISSGARSRNHGRISQHLEPNNMEAAIGAEPTRGRPAARPFSKNLELPDSLVGRTEITWNSPPANAVVPGREGERQYIGRPWTRHAFWTSHPCRKNRGFYHRLQSLRWRSASAPTAPSLASSTRSCFGPCPTRITDQLVMIWERSRRISVFPKDTPLAREIYRLAWTSTVFEGMAVDYHRSQL